MFLEYLLIPLLDKKLCHIFTCPFKQFLPICWTGHKVIHCKATLGVLRCWVCLVELKGKQVCDHYCYPRLTTALLAHRFDIVGVHLLQMKILYFHTSRTLSDGTSHSPFLFFDLCSITCEHHSLSNEALSPSNVDIAPVSRACGLSWGYALMQNTR